MKRSVLIGAFFFWCLCSYSEEITLHIWKDGTFKSIQIEADWNSSIRAFVILDSEMDRLNDTYPNCAFWANSLGWLGGVGSLFYWFQYAVRGATNSAELQAANIVLPTKNAHSGEIVDSPAQQVILHVTSKASNRQYFDANATHGLREGGRYFRDPNGKVQFETEKKE